MFHAREHREALCIVDTRPEELADGRLAVFPLASLIEHSCEPSCFHTVEFSSSLPRSAVMVVRPLKDLKAGEPVSIARIATYLPRLNRQQLLADTRCGLYA